MKSSTQLGMVRQRIGSVALALFLIYRKRSFLPMKSVPCVPYALFLSHKGLHLLRVMRWWPLCKGLCFTPRLVLVIESEWNTTELAEFRTWRDREDWKEQSLQWDDEMIYLFASHLSNIWTMQDKMKKIIYLELDNSGDSLHNFKVKNPKKWPSMPQCL